MTKTVLTLKDRFALNKLVMEEYVKSGMTNTEFAAYASLEIGHKVEDHNIRYILKEFGIPTNEKPKPLSAQAQIDELKARLEVLEQHFTLHVKSGGHSPRIGS